VNKKMETISFLIIIAQMLIIIWLGFMTFKDQIMNLMLGIRRKKAIFLDLRQSKYITLSKDLKTFEMYGKTFVWNFTKELNGCCFFRSDMAESIDTLLEKDKCKYWCDSNEYHTNLKNKMLETLMMLKGKDQIIMLLFVVLLVSGATLALMYIKTGSISDSITHVESIVNAINQSRIQDIQVVK